MPGWPYIQNERQIKKDIIFMQFQFMQFQFRGVNKCRCQGGHSGDHCQVGRTSRNLSRKQILFKVLPPTTGQILARRSCSRHQCRRFNLKPQWSGWIRKNTSDAIGIHRSDCMHTSPDSSSAERPIVII